MPVRGVLRLTNRAMDAEDAVELLGRANVMRLGTVDREGWPYVVPLSYVYLDGNIYFHHTDQESHLTSCLEDNPRVCIEVDEPGPVFTTGGTGCDTSQAFESVIAFGRAALVTGREAKSRVLSHLLAKYADPGSRAPAVYSQLETTLVFQVSIELMTGKKREVS